MVQTLKNIEKMFDDLIGEIGETPKGRRRARIIAAATQLFTERGYRKTSMDEIAQQAVVSKVTIYSYFPTKIDVLISAVALEKREFMAGMAGVFDPKRPAEQRLHELIVIFLGYTSRLPLATRLVKGNEIALLLADAPPALLNRSLQLRDDFMGELLAEVAHASGPKAMREQSVVFSALAYFASAVGEAHVREGLSVQRFAEVLADLLVTGLKYGGLKRSNKGVKR